MTQPALAYQRSLYLQAMAAMQVGCAITAMRVQPLSGESCICAAAERACNCAPCCPHRAAQALDCTTHAGVCSMQAAPWQDKESYFQLSGIHGLPHMAYDGAINPASPFVEGQEFELDGETFGRHGGENAGGLLEQH